jgi:hypothetical protein
LADNNTAIGASALYTNTTGSSNVATGGSALYSNQTGGFNTATGNATLYYNTTGSNNTADGEGALYDNVDGNNNTAIGQNAMRSTEGSNNIALGYFAGVNVTSGSYNINIGHEGSATGNGRIRIGTKGEQIATFIAGIENATVTGAAVYVTSAGQLGVLASSERYKTAITSMGTHSDSLNQLRPVSFRLKSEPHGTLQYGLIAEEVDKVFPELVIRDAEGKIQGVRYDELAPLLLKEVQQQQKRMSAQAQEILALRLQQRAVVELRRQMAEMQAAMLKLQSKDELVARR